MRSPVGFVLQRSARSVSPGVVMTTTNPRVVLELADDRARFRVVLVTSENTNGVPETGSIVERTYENDVDALGVQRWTKLTPDRSGMSDYIVFARALLAHVLAEREELNG